MPSPTPAERCPTCGLVGNWPSIPTRKPSEPGASIEAALDSYVDAEHSLRTACSVGAATLGDKVASNKKYSELFSAICRSETPTYELLWEIQEAIKTLPATDGRVIGLVHFLPRIEAALVKRGGL